MTRLAYYQKEEFGEYRVEMKAWEVAPDQYKYSFVLIKNEKRILGLDNHEHKPPHIHVNEEEKDYDFVNLKKAIYDFWNMAEEVIKDERDNDKV